MKTNIGVFFGGRSTEHEISVISASQAMHAINRDKYDRVKAKMETGKAAPTYFIYKNDRTELGRAKGDMLRYLWAYCPNNDPETYNTLSRIA